MYNLWLEYIILINQEESTAMINVVQMQRRSQGLRCVLEWKHNNHFRYIASRLLSSGIMINSQASITQSLLKLFLCSTIRIKQSVSKNVKVLPLQVLKSIPTSIEIWLILENAWCTLEQVTCKLTDVKMKFLAWENSYVRFQTSVHRINC